MPKCRRRSSAYSSGPATGVSWRLSLAATTLAADRTTYRPALEKRFTILSKLSILTLDYANRDANRANVQ